MRIRAIELGHAQLGWTCAVFFTVATANQFTDAQFMANSGGRWLLTALWRGLREAKRKAKEMAAKPGEREAKGWTA